jgi:hypothetical protein
MPVDVEIGGKKTRITATTKWNELKVAQKDEVVVDLDYYVGSLKVR